MSWPFGLVTVAAMSMARRERSGQGCGYKARMGGHSKTG